MIHTSSEYDYRCVADNRNDIIQAIKQGYIQATGKCLPIFGVAPANLKGYVTYEGDRKKSIFKMPDESYRLKEEDLIEAEPTKEFFDFEKIKAKVLYLKDKSPIPVFRVVKPLSKGSRARVYRVEVDATQKQYALKEVVKDHTLPEKVEDEVIKNSHHKFLLPVEYVFYTANKCYIVTPFMKGGEMYTLLSRDKRFTEERAKFYIAQIIAGLAYLHANHVTYEKLTPENILIGDDGYIYLGTTRFLDGHKPASNCPVEYMPPEVIMGQVHTEASDWWDLGILLYEMLVGVPPFCNPDLTVVWQQITSRPVTFPFTPKEGITISEPAKDFITKVQLFPISLTLFSYSLRIQRNVSELAKKVMTFS